MQGGFMRFGFALPQAGSAIGPEGLVTTAKRAEDLGFDSLWVLDRILWPVNPKVPYPIGDGSLPVKYKNVLDPLETLTFAAAHTRRIALGTSVLNLPWYNPVLLARRLTTLDVLFARRHSARRHWANFREDQRYLKARRSRSFGPGTHRPRLRRAS